MAIGDKRLAPLVSDVEKLVRVDKHRAHVAKLDLDGSGRIEDNEFPHTPSLEELKKNPGWQGPPGSVILALRLAQERARHVAAALDLINQVIQNDSDLAKTKIGPNGRFNRLRADAEKVWEKIPRTTPAYEAIDEALLAARYGEARLDAVLAGLRSVADLLDNMLSNGVRD